MTRIGSKELNDIVVVHRQSDGVIKIIHSLVFRRVVNVIVNSLLIIVARENYE